MSRGPRLSCWMVVACALLPGPLLARQRIPATYVVLELDPDGVPTPVFVSDVDLAVAPPSVAEPRWQLAAAAADGEWVAARLLDPDGRVLHRALERRERWIRGEHRGAETEGGWEIEAHFLRAGRSAVALRLPRLAGARLEVAGPVAAVYDLDALRSGAATLRLGRTGARSRVISVETPQADPANRVDLLVLGDGYRSDQRSLFDVHAAALLGSFFGVSPYEEYANFLNVVTGFVPSAQAGADHPPYLASCPPNDDPTCCADPAALGDPLAGTYVDTAFDARFCSYNIHRLLVVDTAAVLAAAGAYPDWDRILVQVNDTTYGGSGGQISVLSAHAQAPLIGVHEYGHSFTGLADEYDSAFPGYPPCSDFSGPACEANVTDQTALASIKWEPWIPPGTPIPTPENAGYGNVVGLFEGARYRATGMYRPRDTACNMHYLYPYFCEVCRQEYVLRLYRGGWGEPASGIDAIEPGSESPAPGSVSIAATGRVFAAAVLDPAGGPSQQASWRVDGALQPGANQRWFFFDPTASGPYTLELRVEDPTAFVHPDLAGGLLRTTRTWTVAVGPDVIFVDGFASGDTTSWSASAP
ncbi:MAG: hypothetical protein F9K18_04075 [Thermoanaerobaculia bacterium]|nr:MAG: hypothetical protein F9K18_04075 [Thermoanaerobaculia bacterium]